MQWVRFVGEDTAQHDSGLLASLLQNSLADTIFKKTSFCLTHKVVNNTCGLLVVGNSQELLFLDL